MDKSLTSFRISIEDATLVKKRIVEIPAPMPIAGQPVTLPKREIIDEYILTLPKMVLEGAAAKEFVDFLNDKFQK